jgi:hypothetical protein
VTTSAAPRPRLSADPRPDEEVRALADVAASLAGLGVVRPLADGFSLVCREADLVVRIRGAGSDQPCRTAWEVTVREPLPGLSTWWGRWHRTFHVHRSDLGPLVAREAETALARARAMLEDHARS